jgi:putative transposase
MSNIRRFPPNGAPIFITAVCRDRFPILKDSASKALLLDVMREVKAEVQFQMIAYVILDEHFHWLVKPTSHEISKVMQSVKLRFTKRLSAAQGKQRGRRCWQPRFWDHVIRNQSDLNRHLDYIHYNPVKHGYVQRPVDFAYSSFSTYVDKGAYGLHWGTQTEPDTLKDMTFE